VVFETSAGAFEAEVLLEEMPLTAGNFLALVDDGFYDGQHFHRVVKDFMVLTGDPFSVDPTDERMGEGGPPWGSIPDEFPEDQRISNLRGTLSMANKNRPHSGGSQFFVNLSDNAFLDWFDEGPSFHPVFGRVVSGMEVVDAIGGSAVDHASRPQPPVKLVSIRRA